jgi:hypothetical protein
MDYKMYVISQEDELRVGQLFSEHFGKTYLSLAAVRTYMPIRYLDEDSSLVFILFPEDFNLSFLKEHLILHVEFQRAEPMAKSTFEIFNILISKLGKYTYTFEHSDKSMVCAALADYLCVYNTRVDKEYLISDLETSPGNSDSFFTVQSTVPFEIFDYLGEHVVEDSLCWNYDPILWKKQFGE